MIVSWYPGHMAKAKRLIEENLKVVDVIFELLDARVPESSRNPDIDLIAGKKPRVIVLTKTDLADDSVTARFKDRFKQQGFLTVDLDLKGKKGLDRLLKAAGEATKDKAAKLKSKGVTGYSVKAMVLGIPNVGKSTLVNALTGRQVAQVKDKPGVTKGKQWVNVKGSLMLLDMPGILWPKFDDPSAGLKLAFTGAIKDETMDIETLALEFIKLIKELKPDCLNKTYNIDSSLSPEDILCSIAAGRHLLKKGGAADVNRAAITLMDEFRAGKLGKISLDLPKLS